MNSVDFPNFIIFGAEKAGTTSLYHYLNEHPQIFMSPEKEPWFFICENGFPEILGNRIQKDIFVRSRIQKIEDYKKLFKNVKNETAIGEASASYIYVPDAAKKIKSYIPDIKLIAVLRNPADRAYSNFLHCVKTGVEPLRDFEEALQSEETRQKENWGLVFYYKEKGFYYKYLKHYFDLFSENQIKILLYDDFKSDPHKTLKEIYSFLDVSVEFKNNIINQKFNVSPKIGLEWNLPTQILKSTNPLKMFIKDLIPRKTKDQIISTLLKTNTKQIKSLQPKIREYLLSIYKDDISCLEKLIKKDLTAWTVNP